VLCRVVMVIRRNVSCQTRDYDMIFSLGLICLSFSLPYITPPPSSYHSYDLQILCSVLCHNQPFQNVIFQTSLVSNVLDSSSTRSFRLFLICLLPTSSGTPYLSVSLILKADIELKFYYK